jgi:hypothetical protein
MPRIVFAQKAFTRPQSGPAPSWVQPVDYDSTFSPKEKNVEGGEYLELFDEQQNLGKEAVYYKVIRQITSDAGVQNASDISVAYDPSYQHLTFHSVRILRKGKMIDQLQLSRIKLIRNETDLQRFIYSGVYTAYLVLDDVRSGDKIEYSYTLTGTNPILNHHFGDILYFNSGNPISHLFIRLVTDPTRPLYLRYFNKAPEPKQIMQNGHTIYEWRLSNLPAYTPETNEPSWYYGAPHIQLSSDSSWKEIANWAVNTMQGMMNSTDSRIGKMISAWNEEAGNDHFHYIRLATRFVQDQIRYMGIEMGPYSHRPHEPPQVMKQRYGDCKDKALLLCTLLRRRNIDAHVAYVSSTNGLQLPQYLPSVNLFDHAIVTFNLQGVTYWIDPTIAYQRGEIWDNTTPDYSYALIIREGEDSLTPMIVVGDRITQITERFILPKDNNSDCLLDVTTAYGGATANNIRQFFKSSSLEDIQKSYLDYYNQLYTTVSIADSLKFTDDPQENQIIIIEKYRIKKPWILTDSTRQLKVFRAYAKSLQNSLPQAVAADRKSPLSFGTLINLHYRIQVVPPIGLSINSSHEEIKRTDYDYRFDHFNTGDTINMDYTYQTFKNYILPGSFEALNSDLFKINNELSYSIMLNGSVIKVSNKISWLSIILSLIFGGIFSFFAIKAYRFSFPVTQHLLAEARPIRGWLMLIAIGLCLDPLLKLYGIISIGFFSQSVWVGAGMKPGLTFWICVELFMNIFLISYSILLLFLFFNRRNTLPKAIVLLYVINIVIQLMDYWVTKEYSQSASSIPGGIGRSILWGLIWIPYFLYSKWVKETFVYPYRKGALIVTEVTDHEDSIQADEI